MDFKEKIIYILVGMLLFTNSLWCIHIVRFVHEMYNYNYSYSTSNDNSNVNENK